MNKISKSLQKDLRVLDMYRLEDAIDRYICIKGLIGHHSFAQDDDHGEIFWLETCPLCASETGYPGPFFVDTELNTFECLQCRERGRALYFVCLSMKITRSEGVAYAQKLLMPCASPRKKEPRVFS